MKDIKANPLRVTWAQSSDNKIALDDNTRAAGIFYKGPIVSNQLNAVAEDLYKSVAYNQYVGGYYQPSLTYDKNQFCTLMWKQHRNLPAKLISCICREDNVLTAPILNAAVTEENGVAVYSGGSLDVGKWEIRERFPYTYQEVTYDDRAMNIPNGRGFWGSVVPHDPTSSTDPHIIQLSLNDIFNIPLVLSKGFSDLIANRSTFTNYDLMQAQAGISISFPGESLGSATLTYGGSEDFSLEFTNASRAAAAEVPGKVVFDLSKRLPNPLIAANLTPAMVSDFLDESVRIVVENKKLFNEVTNKMTKLITGVDDLSAGLEIVALNGPKVRQPASQSTLGTASAYLSACHAYARESNYVVQYFYSYFTDQLLSNTLFIDTIATAKLSSAQLESRIEFVKACLAIIQALSDDNVIASWAPILNWYASKFDTEALLKLKRDNFKALHDEWSGFISQTTNPVLYLSNIDAKLETVNYSTWQPVSTTGKNEIQQFQAYAGRESMVTGYYPTIIAEQNDLINEEQYDRYWTALASKNVEFEGDLVKEFSFRGKVNWTKLIWVETVKDNLWCNGTDLGDDWRKNVVGTEPDVYHTMTADMELEIKVAYTWNFNTGRYELNMDEAMNCIINYGYVTVSATPKSVYKKPGQAVEINDVWNDPQGKLTRTSVGIYPMAPYNKTVWADYYGLPFGLAFGVKQVDVDKYFNRVDSAVDYQENATLDICFAAMNLIQVKFAGISNLPSSFNFKNLYNMTTQNGSTKPATPISSILGSQENLFTERIFLPVRSYGGTAVLPNLGSRLNIRFKSSYIKGYFAVNTSDANALMPGSSRHSMYLGRMNLSIWNWAKTHNKIDTSKASFWLSAALYLLRNFALGAGSNADPYAELIRELTEESNNVSTSGDQTNGLNKSGASYEICMF